MIKRMRGSRVVLLFQTTRRASPGLALLWWAILLLRGIMPAVLAIATGVLIGAVKDGDALGGPLTFVGLSFVFSLIFTPLHNVLSTLLGQRTGAWLNEQLMHATLSPAGIGHLERPELSADLTMARDFDLGIMGPPLHISMDFIADDLAEMVGGIASLLVLAAFAWWAPIVLGLGWGATHWMLKESGVWRDRNTDEVRTAQRHADYAYRLAVDSPASKELRLFGLAGWVTERFIARRRQLYQLQWKATRLREKSVLGALAAVIVANALVFWRIADSAVDGRTGLAATIVFAQAAIGASMIAFGGLSWAMDGVCAPIRAVMRLGDAMATAGSLDQRGTTTATGPAGEIRFNDVTFAYAEGRPILEHFNLTIPAGQSLAIVGVNGAGKTTLAKLLCRLYDPTGGAIEIDGVDLRAFTPLSWRQRVTAVFQDFIRFERSLRDNVAPEGDADDAAVLAALADAGASHLRNLDTILAKGYEGGTDLSGGQWQRVALARALYAVRRGAGLVVLDEPTAQLDVRGEAEIFNRILGATQHCTTILISHRFSTVRQADRVCVLEHGQVVELGSHDELIALGGRYKTMFELQASRFVDGADAAPDGAATSSEEAGYETLDSAH